MSERKPQGSGRAHFEGDFFEELQDYRRDALTFYFSCDQTHGLVTHGSDRDQQNSVHAVF